MPEHDSFVREAFEWESKDEQSRSSPVNQMPAVWFWISVTVFMVTTSSIIFSFIALTKDDKRLMQER
ncbi:MAG: hypothetical protein EF806_03625 [Candidatus Methanoliparum thermophilum]|uniref:Uncharacterized protein n=1 Tax=Methanoliparum thermophilum TaxID=2491083 RepID=A0A520KRN3_METT2|nr:hypothetical protein [Candidatus Methanoliparum sp. LAM-1]RZN64444.1 MAG: hypothetical protein EF806_03625 [Candidatus Methanoliparum thermophilum]